MRRHSRFLLWVLGFVFVLWASYWLMTRNRLTVINESGLEIHGLTIGVHDETIRLGDLAPGSSTSAHFRIGHEEVFEVYCRLSDGTEVHEYDGYVVWEDDLFGVSVKLTIQPRGTLHFSY
jgi:hypothetical protein